MSFDLIRNIRVLFLPLLVNRLLFAPLAKLLELNFALNFFAIFAGPVVRPFALSAGKSDEIVLRHSVLLFYHRARNNAIGGS